MWTIMSVSSFQEGGSYRMICNVYSICMIHAQILNILLQIIPSSSCVGCCSVFRETLSSIGIQHMIWASTRKPLGFRVDTRISFRLCSKMQVMVSKLMLFVIVVTRTFNLSKWWHTWIKTLSLYDQWESHLAFKTSQDIMEPCVHG